MTPQNFFDYLYYRCLPKVYRDYDDGTLKLFIESLVFGGFKPVIEGEIAFTDLTNPNTCPPEIVPILAHAYGIDHYPSIPEKYYRKLLNNIIELNRRRGSYSSIRYLCRVLTGMEIDMLLEKTPGEKTLYVKLLADTIQDVVDIDTSIRVISTFIGDFIPYYITHVNVSSEVRHVNFSTPIFRTNLIHTAKEIRLPRNYS